MPDREELDLSALSRTPVGALPGASAARARGDQRTRRTRAVLAGGGALVAVLAVTAGAALGGGSDRVMPPPFADPSPSVVQEEGLSVSLLDPSDLSSVRGEPWEVRPTDDLPFDPLPSGCDDPAVFGQPAATALRFLDGPAPYVVGHSLKGYADEAQAQAAFGRVVDALEACDGSGLQLQGGISGSSPSRSYGTYPLDPSRDTVVFAVERIGAVLSGVAIRSFELEDAPPLADAAREAVSGGPFDAPDTDPAPPPPPGAEAALLDVDAASSVEPGDWTVSSLEPGRFFDPCGGEPPLSPAQESASRTLQVLREAGGTTLDHQVLLYGSTDEAAGALQELRDAIERCVPVPVAGGDGTAEYVVVEDGPGELLVRFDTRCPACSPSPPFFLISQASRGLSVLRVEVGEDGGPGLTLVNGYRDAARERLEALVGPS